MIVHFVMFSILVVVVYPPLVKREITFHHVSSVNFDFVRVFSLHHSQVLQQERQRRQQAILSRYRMT